MVHYYVKLVLRGLGLGRRVGNYFYMVLPSGRYQSASYLYCIRGYAVYRLTNYVAKFVQRPPFNGYHGYDNTSLYVMEDRITTQM
jgi:hypothetical protein